MTTCLGTMMSESTKLYNTVQVQKLEAELQLVPETLVHIKPPPLTSLLMRIDDSMRSALCSRLESLKIMTKQNIKIQTGEVLLTEKNLWEGRRLQTRSPTCWLTRELLHAEGSLVSMTYITRSFEVSSRSSASSLRALQILKWIPSLAGQLGEQDGRHITIIIKLIFYGNSL